MLLIKHSKITWGNTYDTIIKHIWRVATKAPKRSPSPQEQKRNWQPRKRRLNKIGLTKTLNQPWANVKAYATIMLSYSWQCAMLREWARAIVARQGPRLDGAAFFGWAQSERLAMVAVLSLRLGASWSALGPAIFCNATARRDGWATRLVSRGLRFSGEGAT